MQLSSTSLPSNLLWKSSRSSSKSKSNPSPSSNVSSPFFSSNQTHHHERLSQARELCGLRVAPSRLKTVKNLKSKHLHSTAANIIIHLSCHISAFYIDVGERRRVPPHIVHQFALRPLLEPISHSAPEPLSHLTLYTSSQPLSVRRLPNNIHTHSYVQSYPIHRCLYMLMKTSMPSILLLLSRPRGDQPV